MSPPAHATVILQAGNSSMRQHPMQAGHSSLRPRQRCRRAVQYCDKVLPQAELLFFETTKIRIGRVTVAANTAAGGPFNTATTGFRRQNYSSLRQRKLESDAHRCGYDCCRRALLLADAIHCSDSRFQAQTWQSVQLRGSFWALPYSDS